MPPGPGRWCCPGVGAALAEVSPARSVVAATRPAAPATAATTVTAIQRAGRYALRVLLTPIIPPPTGRGLVTAAADCRPQASLPQGRSFRSAARQGSSARSPKDVYAQLYSHGVWASL